MAQYQFADSPYRFIDPIRIFKENDPYYFEVDNIPLKQLEENCLWLKDQLQKNVLEIQLADVKRSDIAELKPYASGGDRLVRVKAGRFTARVNDVANKAPLQFLTQVLGDEVGEMDVWSFPTANVGSTEGAILEEALNKFKSYLVDNATHMNGLTERAFTWPVMQIDNPSPYVGTSSDKLAYTSVAGAGELGPAIIGQALLWAKSKDNTETHYLIPSFDFTDQTIGFGRLPLAENHFIKAWRGVARTAIVDVPEEITIEVPPFDKGDFFYIDENGTKVTVEGVQSRIDLVFIYTKPIDASATSVYRGGTVQKITTPVLGIVRGAGIGNSFKTLNTVTNEYDPIDALDSQGNVQILANPSDELDESTGFGSTLPVIRGSFPSPDDILNIAPLLSEKLESNSLELIGQTILPVAYVFVRANADKNVASSDILLETDIIDIRPFFRTAELTYSERAGLAAAMPQVSLANPVTGKAQLDREIRRLKNYTDNKLNEIIQGQGGGGEDSPRGMDVVAGGYVFGGWFFGPESALFNYHYFSHQNNPDPINDTKNFVRHAYLGINDSYSVPVPDYPDWDVARWAESLFQAGTYPNDYLNALVGYHNSVAGGSYKEQTLPGGTNSTGGQPGRFSDLSVMAHDSYQKTGAGFPGGVGLDSSIHGSFISKRIQFNRNQTPWMLDYIVDVNFINCIAATSQHSVGEWGGAGISGWWIEKGYDYFIIYIAFNPPFAEAKFTPDFPAPQKFGGTTIHGRGSSKFASTLVMVHDMMSNDPTAFPQGNSFGRPGYTSNPRLGLCTYPTISWRMYGIPNKESDFYYTNLNSKNPIITLK